MQMPQMRDAEIAGREDEDRITAKLRTAVATPDVCGHIVDAYVAELHVVVWRALAGIPAAQHQLDAGIDLVGVVRRVRVVHRDDIRRVLRTHVTVVVRDDGDPAGAGDQKARMTEKGELDQGLGLSDAHSIARERERRARLRDDLGASTRAFGMRDLQRWDRYHESRGKQMESPGEYAATSHDDLSRRLRAEELCTAWERAQRA